MGVNPGRLVYTQMLNKNSGIAFLLTVTRLSQDALFLVAPSATLRRDLAWLRRHLVDEFVVSTDVTASEVVLPVMGPDTRKLLQAVSPDDFSNEAFPFGTARQIGIGMGLARAHRVTYDGELGWERYVSANQAPQVFEPLMAAGANLRLKLCGLHTLNSCRIGKGLCHFGHETTNEEHVVEAGLGFAVKTGKGDFIGRDTVLTKEGKRSPASPAAVPAE
jgi:heterotetrameric sarcosine oxidase gamma subunit